MEITDLLGQFVQNYDRILPETMKNGDHVWKITIYLAMGEKILIARPVGWRLA